MDFAAVIIKISFMLYIAYKLQLFGTEETLRFAGYDLPQRYIENSHGEISAIYNSKYANNVKLYDRYLECLDGQHTSQEQLFLTHSINHFPCSAWLVFFCEEDIKTLCSYI